MTLTDVKPLTSSPPANKLPAGMLIVIVIGLAVRLAVSYVSWGSNDAFNYHRFAKEVNKFGLLETYRRDGELNHPPLPILWTWSADALCGFYMKWFPYTFRLPIIAFEGVTAWVLWRVWRDRGTSAGRAMLAAGGYALSFCAILVSAYHCNTDSVFAGLAILSVWQLERRRPLSAGLAMAAAINIKLIPVLLLPGLLLSLRSRRELLRFLAGLSVGVIPFLPVLYAAGPMFYRNAIAYTPEQNKWGIEYFLMPHADVPEPDSMPAAMTYYRFAKLPLLAAIVLWAGVAKWIGRWDRYQVSAVTFSIFLFFTPGFGVQYTVMVVPFLLATDVALGILYSVTAGAFIGLVYYLNLTDDWPLISLFVTKFRHPSPLVGLLPWAVLGCAIIAILARGQVARPVALQPAAD